MKWKRISLLLFFVLFLYGGNHANLEASDKSELQETLQYEVSVTLKLIQVFVTDKDGKPARDLEKSDFILYDNGKLQEITDFETHFFSSSPEKAEERARETKPARPEKRQPLMNRKFFIFIDTSNNDPQGMNKSKNAALHFVQTQLQPSDEVTLMTYNWIRGVKIHSYSSTDHGKIQEGIKGLKEIPGKIEGDNLAEGPTLVHVPYEPSFRNNAPYGGGWIPRPNSDDEEEKALVFAKTMQEMAKAFDHIPGYKNIIFFSAGIPRKYLYEPDQIVRDGYENMGKELASSNTPVFTVNTEGARSYTRPGNQRGDFSLKLISDLSGGKYFADVEYYEDIAEDIHNITGNYYVLGYYIDEKWDGKYHEVEVKMKSKGYRVAAQKGYFNPKPFAELSDIEKQLHLIEMALSEEPHFQKFQQIPLIALPFSDKSGPNCVLLSEISLTELGDIANQETELYALIFDDGHNIVESCKGEVLLHRLESKRFFQYSISSLSPGEYQCRAVIRNKITGRSAVGATSVMIQEPFESGISLYPPLILIPGEVSTFFKIARAKKGKEQVSLADVYPYLSNKFSPLIDTLDEGVNELFAVLYCKVAGIEEPNVQLASHLVYHASDKISPMPLSILSSERKEDSHILLLKLDLPHLAEGEYSLVITAEESSLKLKAQTQRMFRLDEN